MSKKSEQKVTVTDNSSVGNITQIVRFGVPTILVVTIIFIALVIGSGYDLRSLLATPPSSPPSDGQELQFVTESFVIEDGDEVKIYFTVWNQHPNQKIRVTDFQLSELTRIPTVFYCCPETRSELTLNFSAKSANRLEPLLETYEIPPLSSHSFVATINLNPGFADNEPIVVFGVSAKYYTVSGGPFETRSDRIYIAQSQSSYGGGIADSFLKNDLEQLYSSNPFIAEPVAYAAQEWFLCPWTNSYLPGSTQISISEQITREITTAPPATKPIASIKVDSLAGWNTGEDSGEIQIDSIEIFTWEEFKNAFPSAELGCDGSLVIEKYDGVIAKVVVSYTNTSDEIAFYVSSRWILSSNLVGASETENRLIPQEIKEQLVSNDYPSNTIYPILEIPDRLPRLGPGETVTQILYFKPIVGEAGDFLSRSSFFFLE